MLRKASHDAQLSHCLVSDFLPHSTCKYRSTSRCPISAVTLKALLHNYWKYHKTYSMTMRYGNQTIMYDDTEDTPAPNKTASLDNTQPTHSIPKQDGEATAKYSDDSNPQCALVELQEHFQQHQEWLTQLKPTANPPAHIAELAHLTDKLQQLALMLQPCPTSRPMEEPLHTAMQKYTDTLCTTQWQKILTISLLQDIQTFDGQGTTKLEDWLSNIKMAADILWRVEHAWMRPNHMA